MSSVLEQILLFCIFLHFGADFVLGSRFCILELILYFRVDFDQAPPLIHSLIYICLLISLDKTVIGMLDLLTYQYYLMNYKSYYAELV